MTQYDKKILVKASHNAQTARLEVPYAQISTLEDLNRWIQLNLHVSSFRLERKSKRHNGYVKLENKKDFKSLKRSLEVKDSLKLKIIDVPVAVSGAGSVGDCGNHGEKGVDSSKEHKNAGITTADLHSVLEQLKELNIKVDSVQKRLTKNRKEGNAAVDAAKAARATTNSGTSTTNIINATGEVEEDIIIDIPFQSNEHRLKVVELVQKFDSAEKLIELQENNEHFEKLLRLVNGDVEKLFALAKGSSSVSSTGSRPTISEGDGYVLVKLSCFEEDLKFELTNYTGYKTPTNMGLVFQSLNAENDVIYTINLHMGQHSILPNYKKILYYGLKGIKRDQLMKCNDYKIMLVKEDSSIFKEGYGQGSQNGEVYLRSPGYSESQDIGEVEGEEVMNDDAVVDSDEDEEVEVKETTSSELAQGQEQGDDNSSTSSNFVTPSNSTFLNFDETQEPTIQALNDPFSKENLNDSGTTLTSNNILNEKDEETHDLSTTDDGEGIVTDFSEVSDNESHVGDDYEVLSTDDYASECD